MKLEGEQKIEAGREAVWRGLNDAEVLRRSIPGCESLVQEADNRFKAVVAIKIGPIGARFTGAVDLSDLDPPLGYTLSGEGQGGVAGSARGSARVRLEEDAGTTRLLYTVDAQVGGRLAQLGGAIIDATARQLAGRFFARFAEEVGAGQKAPALENAEGADAQHTGQVSGAPAALAASPVASAAGDMGASPTLPLLIVALLAAYVLGAFQAGADLSGADSLVVAALLVIVAIGARLAGRPVPPKGP